VQRQGGGGSLNRTGRLQPTNSEAFPLFVVDEGPTCRAEGRGYNLPCDDDDDDDDDDNLSYLFNRGEAAVPYLGICNGVDLTIFSGTSPAILVAIFRERARRFLHKSSLPFPTITQRYLRLCN
jgi:hypothetical protein